MRTATSVGEGLEGGADRALGQDGEELLGLLGAGDDVGAGLVHRGVLAQQVEGLGVEVVVGEVGGEQLAQPGVGGVGRRLGHQHRQRGHALAQVGAGRLAGLGRLRGDVEDVVGELEGGADELAVLRQRGDHLRRRAAEHRAVAGGRGDQGAGLAGDHLEVVLQRVVVGPGLDGLEDLALDQPGERLGLDPHRLRARARR